MKGNNFIRRISILLVLLSLAFAACNSAALSTITATESTEIAQVVAAPTIVPTNTSTPTPLPMSTPVNTHTPTLTDTSSPTPTHAPVPTNTPEPRCGQVGCLAPDFALTNARDGSTVRLSDYAGKIRVIYFGASWCAPCRTLSPYMANVSRVYQRVVVLWVNVNEPADVAVAYVDQHQGVGPVLLDGYLLSGAYSILGIPHVVFIGPDGRIRDVHVGWVPDEAWGRNLNDQ